MNMGPVSFSVLLLAPALLAAQQQSTASLGVGSGVVRYSGGASPGAFTVSPALQLLTTTTYLGATGAVSLLQGGVWASQGRADLWSAFSARATGVRPAISLSLASSGRSDGVAAGSGAALLEAVWNGVAIGAGGVTGVIQGVSGVGALRVRGRAWVSVGTLPTQLSLSVENTRFLGAWYSDIVAGTSIDHRRVVASLWLSGRVSGVYPSSGAASASLQYFLGPSIAVEIAGGNYLRDPFQGLPQAGYIAGGFRFFATRRAIRSAPAATVQRPVLQPLVAERRGDSVVVRFHMPGAHAVGIAGSWNGWTPAPLNALGNDIWEAALLLPAGTYYFNLVVDGNDWVVPGGVATISDGMGGLLAVLNVL
jgi:hypothetical protein